MGSFHDLLSVQEHDSAIDRLRAQREKLPERQQIQERQAQIADLTAQVEVLSASREEAARDEKRLDDTVTAIRERMAEVEANMYSGSITNPRELQAMQAEVEQFQRQLRGLEDQELDVMERREELDGDISGLESTLGSVREDLSRLESALAEQEADLDAQIATEQQARNALVPGIPSDLVELYEQVRSKNRGVGAARLVGGSCMACHLALPAVEVDRIKKLPADEMARCEQCGAILVRD
ncbi:MAG TPA: C4-type zinc ribbon domain-containing protein [Acidimicrobiia bacterium]|nr:C4-type zinc ribbon domain-containing protein [Acidimicrobiia bacterium]